MRTDIFFDRERSEIAHTISSNQNAFRPDESSTKEGLYRGELGTDGLPATTYDGSTTVTSCLLAAAGCFDFREGTGMRDATCQDGCYPCYLPEGPLGPNVARLDLRWAITTGGEIVRAAAILSEEERGRARTTTITLGNTKYADSVERSEVAADIFARPIVNVSAPTEEEIARLVGYFGAYASLYDKASANPGFRFASRIEEMNPRVCLVPDENGEFASYYLQP